MTDVNPSESKLFNNGYTITILKICWDIDLIKFSLMKKNIKQIKQKNTSRCKQISIVIQPNLVAEFWSQKNLKDELIEEKLLQTGYPLYTEIKYALESCAALSSTGKGDRLPVSYAFST